MVKIGYREKADRRKVENKRGIEICPRCSKMQHEGSASVVLRLSACAATYEKKGHVALATGARRQWWTRSRAPDRRTRRTMPQACSRYLRSFGGP